jgi:hypothetical protein
VQLVFVHYQVVVVVLFVLVLYQVIVVVVVVLCQVVEYGSDGWL